jgi:hypothetical protein
MLQKVLWNSLLVTPALLGAALITSSAIAADATVSTQETEALLNEIAAVTEFQPAATIAAPVQLAQMPVETQAPAATPVAPVAPVAPAAPVAPMTPAAPVEATPSVDSMQQLQQYSNEGAVQPQVSSVSQLSDVRPTDWAFQALSSLVERYGCIAGYPDGTFKGNRAMTRYEFAAGLNACLDRINELIAQATADFATKEDLATLQRLQEEFAAELATLRGRVDSLEARTAELEANQFSTTTKLRGETIFNVAVPFGQDDSLFDDQAVLDYRVRLNFDTSFSGDDLLRARLEAVDATDFASFANTIGSSNSWAFGNGPGGVGDDNIRISDLYYTFPVGERMQVTLAANGVSDSDWVVSTVSPLDNAGQGALSNFSALPQYQFVPGGAGLGLNFQLGDNLSFDAAYAASEASNPAAGSGLFNGDYGIIAQLTYLSESFDAALTYANGYRSNGFGPSGLPEVANTYGGQFNFKISDGFQIGGGAAYVPITTLGTGSYKVWSYQGTLAFPDLGGEGNLLGLLVGVPPRITSVSPALGGVFPALAGGQDASLMSELFYRLRINDNISVTPGVIWLNDPGNNNNVDDTFIGAVRTTFTF